MQLNRKTPFLGRPWISQTAKPIKRNGNMPHAKIVNQATKYFTQHFTEILESTYHTCSIDISLMDLQATSANNFHTLANASNSPISVVTVVLDSLSDLQKTLL